MAQEKARKSGLLQVNNKAECISCRFKVFDDPGISSQFHPPRPAQDATLAVRQASLAHRSRFSACTLNNVVPPSRLHQIIAAHLSQQSLCIIQLRHPHRVELFTTAHRVFAFELVQTAYWEATIIVQWFRAATAQSPCRSSLVDLNSALERDSLLVPRVTRSHHPSYLPKRIAQKGAT